MSDDAYIPSGTRERRMSDRRPKRTRKAARGGEPVVVPRKRSAKSELRKQIERGLNRDTAGSDLSRQLAFAVRTCDRKQLAAARSMLYWLERNGARILESPTAAAGVVHLARFHDQFIREPTDFALVGETPAQQLRELARHALEHWPVPHWLDSAWLHNNDRTQKWFAHLAAGKNLSDAPDLPFELSKRAAHFAVNAPPRLNAHQALRWAQLRAQNAPEELCDEVVHTRLSTALPDEPFWKTVIAWFASYPEVYGHANVIVDYLFAQRIGDFARPPRPDYSMRGRAPDRLLADATAWHEALVRQNRMRDSYNVPKRWSSCGIAGFAPKTDAGADSREKDVLPSWVIVELTSLDDLIAEGDRLHHCVASYASACAAHRSAVFSLRRLMDDELKPRVTIEVYPEQHRIVQARGAHNATPNDADRKLIERWAKTVGLAIERFVFPRQ